VSKIGRLTVLYLLAKSTLPDKEKRKTALRILHKPERNNS